MRRHRGPTPRIDRSAFAGYRFPPDVIILAVRWYLRYGLSYRDLEELLAERGLVVDHVSVYRWVQTFTPLLIDAARCRRHGGGDRWFVDETYVRVSGRWMYLHRAVDQHGQVIDVLLSDRRDLPAARCFFRHALATSPPPAEVNTDLAGVYPTVLEELVPGACHVTDRYANNRIEADHGRLKARLRPMRGLKRARSLRIVAAGHALVQNIRRGHYDLAANTRPASGCTPFETASPGSCHAGPVREEPRDAPPGQPRRPPTSPRPPPPTPGDEYPSAPGGDG